jgi:hypothetical protein
MAEGNPAFRHITSFLFPKKKLSYGNSKVLSREDKQQ